MTSIPRSPQRSKGLTTREPSSSCRTTSALRGVRRVPGGLPQRHLFEVAWRHGASRPDRDLTAAPQPVVFALAPGTDARRFVGSSPPIVTPDRRHAARPERAALHESGWHRGRRRRGNRDYVHGSGSIIRSSPVTSHLIRSQTTWIGFDSRSSNSARRLAPSESGSISEQGGRLTSRCRRRGE